MEIRKQRNRIFLYWGLSLLLIAFVIRWMGAGEVLGLFWIVFGAALLLKAVFLVNVFRVKGFRMTLWLKFILAGVLLIFVSLIFKYSYPVPIVRNILFYGAISLKVTGLLLMVFQKKKDED